MVCPSTYHNCINPNKYFVTPAGLIVRAFTMENILFRDRDRMKIRDPLLRPDIIEAVGTRYVIQKNRRNGQVIWYSRDVANPSFCPVVRALSLVRRAKILGQSPSDPSACTETPQMTQFILQGQRLPSTSGMSRNWSTQTSKQMP